MAKQLYRLEVTKETYDTVEAEAYLRSQTLKDTASDILLKNCSEAAIGIARLKIKASDGHMTQEASDQNAPEPPPLTMAETSDDHVTVKLNAQTSEEPKDELAKIKIVDGPQDEEPRGHLVACRFSTPEQLESVLRLAANNSSWTKEQKMGFVEAQKGKDKMNERIPPHLLSAYNVVYDRILSDIENDIPIARTTPDLEKAVKLQEEEEKREDVAPVLEFILGEFAKRTEPTPKQVAEAFRCSQAEVISLLKHFGIKPMTVKGVKVYPLKYRANIEEITAPAVKLQEESERMSTDIPDSLPKVSRKRKDRKDGDIHVVLRQSHGKERSVVQVWLDDKWNRVGQYDLQIEEAERITEKAWKETHQIEFVRRSLKYARLPPDMWDIAEKCEKLSKIKCNGGICSY